MVCFSYPFCFIALQGKNAEGMVHLERVASLEEPEDPNSKVHYYNSLVFLARYETNGRLANDYDLLPCFFSISSCNQFVHNLDFFSALVNEGRKAEALKYLRLAVAYNPAYKELLEQCENEDEEFGSDLVNSRRRDY